jgi:hypothetical protein
MDAAPGPQPISERVLRDGELRSLDWNKQRRSWEELRTALPPHSPRKELWIRRCRPHTKVSRRVKTQGSLPAEDAALVPFSSVVSSGQIELRRIDGWRGIAASCSRIRR